MIYLDVYQNLQIKYNITEHICEKYSYLYDRLEYHWYVGKQIN